MTTETVKEDPELVETEFQTRSRSLTYQTKASLFRMTDELVILRSYAIVLVIVLLAIGVRIWMLKGFIFEWADKKIHATESKREKGLKKRSKKHSISPD